MFRSKTWTALLIFALFASPASANNNPSAGSGSGSGLVGEATPTQSPQVGPIESQPIEIAPISAPIESGSGGTGTGAVGSDAGQQVGGIIDQGGSAGQVGSGESSGSVGSSTSPETSASDVISNPAPGPVGGGNQLIASARERVADAVEAARKAVQQATGSDLVSTSAALKKAEATAKAINRIEGASAACLEFIETGVKPQTSCEPARYVIRFAPGINPADQIRAMKAAKIPISSGLSSSFPGAVSDLSAEQLRTVVYSTKIATVEQDFEIKLDPTAPADFQISPTWGLDRLDQVMLPLSGGFTNPNQGKGVLAYVVDTGVLADHSEFSGRVDKGFSAVSDAIGSKDCHGHGTHVAGTIAGLKYGVAKQATVVPVRVLDCAGSGNLSGVLAGLDWIAANHPAGEPGVVNMSLGGGTSASLDLAVDALVASGITVVVSAGNSKVDACGQSPARAPKAITVAASDVKDGFASFSNFGECVDIVAPGVSITSAGIASKSSTAALSGTSMAAPHVSGLVAAAMSKTYLAPNEVELILKAAAAKDVVKYAPSSTSNLLAQVADPTSTSVSGSISATIPYTPVLKKASFYKDTARITWKIAADGGSPILSHSVRVWQSGRLVKKVDVGPKVTTAKASGLKVGASYNFTVVTTNAIGNSLNSAVTKTYKPKR